MGGISILRDRGDGVVAVDELVFEIRQADDPTRESAGRLTGVLLRYGEVARNLKEVFAQGALSWPAEGIVINEQHNRAAPILRTIPFEIDGEVRIDAPVPATQRGRDAITNIREGVFSGLSIEFASRSEGRRGNLREIRKAHLRAGALVDVSAYSDSKVEIRGEARERPWSAEDVLRWL